MHRRVPYGEKCFASTLTILLGGIASSVVFYLLLTILCAQPKPTVGTSTSYLHVILDESVRFISDTFADIAHNKMCAADACPNARV